MTLTSVLHSLEWGGGSKTNGVMYALDDEEYSGRPKFNVVGIDGVYIKNADDAEDNNEQGGQKEYEKSG